MSSLGDLLEDPFGDKGVEAALTLLDPADFATGRGAREIERSAKETQESQTAELQRQFDIGQARIEPTFQEAVPAFERQAALSGALGGEAQGLALQGFQEAPGTQFARQQGLRLIESGAAATGGLGGGDRLRQLSEFGTQLATRGLGNEFGRLGVVSGSGQGAGTELVGLGSRFAGNVANVAQTGAQGQIAAIQQGQQQRANAATTGVGLLAAFSDKDMKTDIKDLSHEECFNHVMSTPLFAWKYLEECGIDKDEHFGPMYQDAPDCIKTDGEKSLQVHDELWLIAGAMKHMMGVKNG